MELLACTEMPVLRLRQDHLTWREVDGEIVAVDLTSSRYLSANPAGALLWQMLATGTTREALIARLVEEFDITEDRADADVAAFIDALAARNLLAT
jgi:hypothetical protein